MTNSRGLPVLVSVLLAAVSLAEPITDRMSLLEAIEAVKAQGYPILYSSQLVQPWMRVREAPDSTEPLQALDAVLAHYQLRLLAEEGGRWLIVENPVAQSAPVRTSQEPAVAKVAPKLLTIDEITIVANRHSLYDRGNAADQYLTADEIRSMPHLADDAFRALHYLPGAAANDFQAPFNLRGGANDEVKVLLDGLELFEPFHMRSLFSPLSIIDPGIIRDAEVLSGGFPVDQGNHMSGVVDIRSAPAEEAVHQVGVSFVSSFVRSSGPFDSGRGGYQVSARRGYLDLIADSLVNDNETLNPKYSDLFFQTSYAVSDSLDVAANLLLAADNVTFRDPADGENFGEDSTLRYGWLVANATPTDRIRINTVLSGGRVHSIENGEQINPPAENITRYYSRLTRIGGLRSDAELKLDDNRLWRFGAQFRQLEGDFDYRLDSSRQSDFVNNGVPYTAVRNFQTIRDGDEIGTYAAYRFRALSELVLELGVRWDKQTYTKSGDGTQISPRLNGVWQIDERSELRFAWGRYYQPQGIEELQLPDGVDRYFPAEEAEHRVLGFRHRFRSGIGLQADLYDKHYLALRPRFENALDRYEFAPESNFDRVRVGPDNARAYGLEITLRKRQAQGLDWWFNYTWSRATDSINNVKVPRSWDQRHALTANLTWSGEKWTITAVGRYHSGWPRTPLLIQPILDANGIPVGIESDISRRNDENFNDYSRIDIRASRRVPLARGTFEYYFELFNVFDTGNQCCISNHELTFGPAIAATPTIDNYMPRFPSFGFVWTFGPGAN
jgi:hypothetical protein